MLKCPEQLSIHLAFRFMVCGPKIFNKYWSFVRKPSILAACLAGIALKKQQQVAVPIDS